MNEYRIVTNGETYAIQQLFKYRFLIWKWERWETLGGKCGVHRDLAYLHKWKITEYPDKESAQRLIDIWRHQEQLKENGWKPVE